MFSMALQSGQLGPLVREFGLGRKLFILKTKVYLKGETQRRNSIRKNTEFS